MQDNTYHKNQFKEISKLKEMTAVNIHNKKNKTKLYKTYNKFWIKRKTLNQNKKIPLINTSHIMDKDMINKWGKNNTTDHKNSIKNSENSL